VPGVPAFAQLPLPFFPAYPIAKPVLHILAKSFKGDLLRMIGEEL
jgi:hypothetical protein